MLLEAMEAQLYTEMSENVKLARQLTIEHLMPQQWHTNWPLPTDLAKAEAEVRREQAIELRGKKLFELARQIWLRPAVTN